MEHGTQTKIAERIGVTPQFINQILSGARRPSWNKAKLLAGVTGIKPELWLDGTPEAIRDAVDGLELD